MTNIPLPPYQQALKAKIEWLKSTKEALVNAINDRIKATDDALSTDLSDFLDRKNKEINSLFLADTVVSHMFDQYGEKFCFEFHMSGDSFSEIVRNVHDAISCKIRELKRWESKYTTALARRTDEKNRLTELLKFLETKPSDNSSQGEVS